MVGLQGTLHNFCGDKKLIKCGSYIEYVYEILHFDYDC